MPLPTYDDLGSMPTADDPARPMANPEADRLRALAVTFAQKLRDYDQAFFNDKERADDLLAYRLKSIAGEDQPHA